MEKSDIEKMRDILDNSMDRFKKGDKVDDIRKEFSGAIIREKLTIKDDENKQKRSA